MNASNQVIVTDHEINSHGRRTRAKPKLDHRDLPIASPLHQLYQPINPQNSASQSRLVDFGLAQIIYVCPGALHWTLGLELIELVRHLCALGQIHRSPYRINAGTQGLNRSVSPQLRIQSDRGVGEWLYCAPRCLLPQSKQNSRTRYVVISSLVCFSSIDDFQHDPGSKFRCNTSVNTP